MFELKREMTQYFLNLIDSLDKKEGGSEQFAKDTQIGKQTIQHWRTGRNYISDKNAEDLARYFGVDIVEVERDIMEKLSGNRKIWDDENRVISVRGHFPEMFPNYEKEHMKWLLFPSKTDWRIMMDEELASHGYTITAPESDEEKIELINGFQTHEFWKTNLKEEGLNTDIFKEYFLYSFAPNEYFAGVPANISEYTDGYIKKVINEYLKVKLQEVSKKTGNHYFALELRRLYSEAKTIQKAQKGSADPVLIATKDNENYVHYLYEGYWIAGTDVLEVRNNSYDLRMIIDHFFVLSEDFYRNGKELYASCTPYATEFINFAEEYWGF